jgi:hypothetical protein
MPNIPALAADSIEVFPSSSNTIWTSFMSRIEINHARGGLQSFKFESDVQAETLLGLICIPNQKGVKMY